MNDQPESRVREIRPSGSEGGGTEYPTGPSYRYRSERLSYAVNSTAANVPGTDYVTRRPRGDFPSGQALRDDCSCANDGALTDANIGQDENLGANPDEGFENDFSNDQGTV